MSMKWAMDWARGSSGNAVSPSTTPSRAATAGAIAVEEEGLVVVVVVEEKETGSLVALETPTASSSTMTSADAEGTEAFMFAILSTLSHGENGVAAMLAMCDTIGVRIDETRVDAPLFEEEEEEEAEAEGAGEGEEERESEGGGLDFLTDRPRELARRLEDEDVRLGEDACEVDSTEERDSLE